LPGVPDERGSHRMPADRHLRGQPLPGSHLAVWTGESRSITDFDAPLPNPLDTMD